MSEFLEFLEKLTLFPTIFPAVLAITATFLMLLSIVVSLDHLFADSWHFNVDHDMEPSFSNNFIAFLGIKRKVPMIPFVTIITWGMTGACFIANNIFDMHSSWWRILFGIAFLIVILPISSRIANFLMLPIANFIEKNSGKSYSIIGKVGIVTYIKADENYVRIEFTSEGIDSSVVVFVNKSEINNIIIGDEIVIVEQKLDPNSDDEYYFGGKIN